MADRKAIYFLSDLHLGAKYLGDTHRAERHVNAFLDSIKYDAKELFLVGDVLDYWYEYRNVVPRGYTRFFGKLAELSDMGIKITWLIGNHDIWIFDYLPSELGITVEDGYIIRNLYGRLFFISHGDGMGKRPMYFRMMRSLFRNRLCQWLYAGIHPRWTIPFAHAWSSHSRVSHQPIDTKTDLSPAALHLLEASADFLMEHPGISYFVYGHLHEELDLPLGCNSRMIVLGDWISQFTYARFDGEEMTLHRYSE